MHLKPTNKWMVVEKVDLEELSEGLSKDKEINLLLPVDKAKDKAQDFVVVRADTGPKATYLVVENLLQSVKILDREFFLIREHNVVAYIEL